MCAEDGAWQEVDIPPPGIGEAPIDGQQYVRSDAGWEQVEVPPGTVIADNAPTAPPNTLWWSSVSGLLSIRYDDGNSQQWVGLNGALGGGDDADTPPAATFPGMLWWESDSGELSIRYNDGDSEQWVSATGGATDPSKVAKTGDTMTR